MDVTGTEAVTTVTVVGGLFATFGAFAERVWGKPEQRMAHEEAMEKIESETEANSSSASALAALAAGTNGHYLTLSSGSPAWQALSVSLTTQVTGVLPVANGGTGLSSLVYGDLMAYISGTTWSRVPIGTRCKILQSNYQSSSNYPNWITPPLFPTEGVPAYAIPKGVGETTLETQGMSGGLTLAGTVAALTYNGYNGLSLSTTSSSGNIASIRGNDVQFFNGYFRAAIIFAVPATDTLQRFFVGFQNVTSAPSNVDPDTLTNCIGVAKKASDQNWYLVHGAGSANTEVAISNSKTLNNTQYAIAEFESIPTGGCKVVLRSLGGGAAGEATTTTGPSGATGLAFRIWLCNNEAAIRTFYFFGAKFEGMYTSV